MTSDPDEKQGTEESDDSGRTVTYEPATGPFGGPTDEPDYSKPVSVSEKSDD